MHQRKIVGESLNYSTSFSVFRHPSFNTPSLSQWRSSTSPFPFSPPSPRLTMHGARQHMSSDSLPIPLSPFPPPPSPPHLEHLLDEPGMQLVHALADEQGLGGGEVRHVQHLQEVPERQPRARQRLARHPRLACKGSVEGSLRGGTLGEAVGMG
jgi:hypothetical protein